MYGFGDANAVSITLDKEEYLYTDTVSININLQGFSSSYNSKLLIIDPDNHILSTTWYSEDNTSLSVPFVISDLTDIKAGEFTVRLHAPYNGGSTSETLTIVSDYDADEIVTLEAQIISLSDEIITLENIIAALETLIEQLTTEEGSETSEGGVIYYEDFSETVTIIIVKL